MCTKFGADSSNRFPFRARTNEQTDRPIQPAWVMKNLRHCYLVYYLYYSGNDDLYRTFISANFNKISAHFRETAYRVGH